MAEVVSGLYTGAFTVWNFLIKIAMTLFTTSPKVAGSGTLYSTVYTIYQSISAATIPLATVFFIIGLYKTVISAPPEQQAQRFIMDAVRYCIILFVAANLWSIMGYIIDFADGITAQIGSAGTYEISVSGDLMNIIQESLELPEFALTGEWFKELWEVIGCSFLFLIGGVILIFIVVASSLSILSCAYQRILKPLVILPFSGIAVAMGAGGQEVSRSMWQYVKTFIGFCISGALMIICIKVGGTLCTNLVNFNLAGESDIGKVILITVQTAVTPIVIAGLVKGSDSIISRMF